MIDRIKICLRNFFIEHALMSQVDRKRLRERYGKEYWRCSKEYIAFWNRFDPINILLGGIAIISSCFIYRRFHSIHIISKAINEFILNEVAIINEVLKTGSVARLVLNWNFVNDVILIVGIVVVGVSVSIIYTSNYLPEVVLLIKIIKFAFFILVFETLRLYSVASAFTNVMVVMISIDIYALFKDIFNWVIKKENVRMDYKRLSVLIGILAAIYGLIR